VSCLLAYGIKLFYFDVVDEWAGVERRQQLGIGVAATQQPKHPLHFQHGGGRWRANLWIGSHVFIIMSVGTVGAAARGPTWRSCRRHGWSPRAHQAASGGSRLPCALVRSDAPPQMPPARPCQSQRVRRV